MMARNKVQFQKGLSEPAFELQYGTEEQCRAVVVASRWPNGFECPACGEARHSMLKCRELFQCTGCRRQTSLIAGTIFASTKLPLRLWFRAIYHLTQSKQGISSIELGRRLGVDASAASSFAQQAEALAQAPIRQVGRQPLTDYRPGGTTQQQGQQRDGHAPAVSAQGLHGGRQNGRCRPFMARGPGRWPLGLRTARTASACPRARSGHRCAG